MDQQKCENKPHYITRSGIKTDLKKDTISRALYRIHLGFHSRSPRKVPLLKTKHVKDRLKFVETYEKKRYAVLGKGNLVGWNESWTIRKEHSDKCLAKKWHCLQEGQYHLHSLGVVPLRYGNVFHPRAQVSYKLSMVVWMVTCTGRFLRRTFRNLQLL